MSYVANKKVKLHEGSAVYHMCTYSVSHDLMTQRQKQWSLNYLWHEKVTGLITKKMPWNMQRAWSIACFHHLLHSSNSLRKVTPQIKVCSSNSIFLAICFDIWNVINCCRCHGITAFLLRRSPRKQRIC